MCLAGCVLGHDLQPVGTAMDPVGRHREPWLPTEVAQLEAMIAQEIDPEEIALRLGRTGKAVQTKIWALRLRSGDRGVAKRKQRRANGASFFLS